MVSRLRDLRVDYVQIPKDMSDMYFEIDNASQNMRFGSVVTNRNIAEGLLKVAISPRSMLDRPAIEHLTQIAGQFSQRIRVDRSSNTGLGLSDEAVETVIQQGMFNFVTIDDKRLDNFTPELIRLNEADLDSVADSLTNVFTGISVEN